MPENVFKKLRASIAPQWNVCFWSAIMVGLLAHLYKIVNWLPNWDSLVFRYDAQNMIHMGRWALPVVCCVVCFFDLPFLNGILAILFHALGAVCICRMLNVQNKITAFLIGAVVVTFPTVTSVMMYSYVAEGYGIAFFLSTLAAMLMTQEKPRYLLSTLLIAVSVGIYQAYITVTVTLILIKLIDDIIHQGSSFGATVKKASWMLLTGVLGMVVYVGVLTLLLRIFSMELVEYQGINSVSVTNINIPAALYIIKETFIGCFFDVSGGVNVYVILNIVVLLLTVAYYVMSVIHNKVYKKPLAFALAILFAVLLIPGAAILAFVNSSVDYHNLMRMGYVAFYLLFLVLYEREAETHKTHAAIRCWAVLAIAMTVIINQVVIANVSYHKAQLAYEKSYGVLIRIADRIEQTPEADTCTKLLVLGALENSEDYSVNLTPEITGITDGYILRADDEIVQQSVLCSALKDYCEKQYTFISGEDKDALAQRDDVQAMGVWPSKDCVAVIDDVVVVKLSSEG